MEETGEEASPRTRAEYPTRKAQETPADLRSVRAEALLNGANEIVAVDAVWCEPVSATPFPANREINRDSEPNGRLSTRLGSKSERIISDIGAKFPIGVNREFVQGAWEFCAAGSALRDWEDALATRARTVS